MTLFLSPQSSVLSPSLVLGPSLAIFGLDLHAIQDLVTRYGWWGILFLMALQGATMPIANEITMPLAGWLLIQAVGKPKALILFAGLVGATGWVIGALVAYAVMAVGGRALLARLRRRFPQVEKALARSDAWFERWGAWAAFIARLLPISRTIITLPAGAARVPVIPFAAATFAGAFIWSTFLAALGYAAGSQWDRVRGRLGQWYLPVTIATIVLSIVGYVAFSLLRERRAPKDSPSPLPGNGEGAGG
ncbi:MAG: DedA family protein [Thermomicrobia bacterium]|nr:DedA family protein [Thermomicrobia bacterium]